MFAKMLAEAIGLSLVVLFTFCGMWLLGRSVGLPPEVLIVTFAMLLIVLVPGMVYALRLRWERHYRSRGTELQRLLPALRLLMLSIPLVAMALLGIYLFFLGAYAWSTVLLVGCTGASVWWALARRSEPPVAAELRVDAARWHRGLVKHQVGLLIGVPAGLAAVWGIGGRRNSRF